MCKIKKILILNKDQIVIHNWVKPMNNLKRKK